MMKYTYIYCDINIYILDIYTMIFHVYNIIYICMYIYTYILLLLCMPFNVFNLNSFICLIGGVRFVSGKQ